MTAQSLAKCIRGAHSHSVDKAVNSDTAKLKEIYVKVSKGLIVETLCFSNFVQD